MNTENVERKTGYTQVCVWEGSTVVPHDAAMFEERMLIKLGVRVQFLEEITTKPLFFEEDGDDLVEFESEEDRTDLFFAVYDHDLQAFSGQRLKFGIRWVEDVYWDFNFQRGNYPCRIECYRTWDPDEMSDSGMMGLGNLIPSNRGDYPTMCHSLPDHRFIV
jgi:hypothetical protein